MVVKRVYTLGRKFEYVFSEYKVEDSENVI